MCKIFGILEKVLYLCNRKKGKGLYPSSDPKQNEKDMRNIIATFRLDTHEKEFNHFIALFGSRYTYYYTTFDGVRIVDVIE